MNEKIFRFSSLYLITCIVIAFNLINKKVCWNSYYSEILSVSIYFFFHYSKNKLNLFFDYFHELIIHFQLSRIHLENICKVSFDKVNRTFIKRLHFLTTFFNLKKSTYLPVDNNSLDILFKNWTKNSNIIINTLR